MPDQKKKQASIRKERKNRKFYQIMPIKVRYNAYNCI